MKNIRIIETGIDVSGILKQLKQYPEDWGAVRKIDGSHNLIDDYHFPEVEAGILQLIMGGVDNEKQFVGDTEICIPTEAFYHHTAVIEFLKSKVRSVSRCGFLSLPVGGSVGTHIDVGNYYLTRDRYHLSIQGEYEYTVGDETVLVKPGTFLWFDNKLMHGTRNVGKDVRVTFVFDVPHSPNNP